MKCRCGTEMYQQEDIAGTLCWVCPSCYNAKRVKGKDNEEIQQSNS